MKYVVFIFAMVFAGLANADVRTTEVKEWGYTNTGKIALIVRDTTWLIPVDHCPVVEDKLLVEDAEGLQVHTRTIREGARFTLHTANDAHQCSIETIER